MPPSTIVHTAPKRTPRIAPSCHAIRRNIRRAPWLQIDPKAAFLAQSWQESAAESAHYGSSQLQSKARADQICPRRVVQTRPIWTLPDLRPTRSETLPSLSRCRVRSAGETPSLRLGSATPSRKGGRERV